MATLQPLTSVTGLAAPLMLEDVDTDVITPMGRIMTARPNELGRYAFEPLRYADADAGVERSEFVLNRPPWRDRACILLAGRNFGCGSSRETAVWAITQMGFRVVIAPSFGDIFHDNCFQNGVLPVRLPEAEVRRLAELAWREPRAEQTFRVDLQAQTVTAPDGAQLAFEVDPFRRDALLRGLDDLGMTLTRVADIDAFQDRDRQRRPWIWCLADASGSGDARS